MSDKYFDPREIVEEYGFDQFVGLSRRGITKLTGLGSHRAAQVLRYVASNFPHPAQEPTLRDEQQAAKADSHSYNYDIGADRYSFVWPGRTAPMILAGEIVRSMVNDYVEDGQNLPMHDVAIRHGVSRRDFERIKTALGVTKRHEPFSPEEIRDRDEDDLFDTSMEAKRRRLAARVEREDYRQVRDSAAKWLAFTARTLDPFEEKIQNLLTGVLPPVPAPQPTNDEVRSDYKIAHIHTSDLHFGAYSSSTFGGRGYDRKEARKRFMRGISEAAERLSHEKIKYVILVCGGDMVHSDNIHGKTSSFRHQMDMDGLPEEVLTEAIDMYIDGVQHLLACGHNVHIEVVPGNHDYYTSIAMGKAAALCFRNDERVSYGNLIAPFAYHYYGNTALVLHHGHGLNKASDLADNLQTHSRRSGVSYLHGYAITGNLHHIKMDEDPGIVLLQQPAPVEPDRYAVTNGWSTARPGMIVYCFSARDGLTTQHHIWFDRG
jgi:hypothetical protein